MKIFAYSLFLIALLGAGVAVYTHQSDQFPVITLEPPISAQYYTRRYEENREGQTRHTIKVDGVERTYWSYARDETDNSPKPMVLLLHGSKRSGVSLVEHWKPLADEHNLILIGPNGWNQQWSMQNDGTDFIDALLDDVKQKFNVDPSQMYIFGHSRGGMRVLYLAIEYSEVFAAVALHAGSFYKADDARLVAKAKRKIPIAFYVGSDDDKFPVSDVTYTAKAYADHGHDAPVFALKEHNHWYYTLSGYINRLAWEFLKGRYL